MEIYISNQEDPTLNKGMSEVNIEEVNPNPDHDKFPDPFSAPISGFVFSRDAIEGYVRRHLADAMQEMGMSMRDMAVRGGDKEGKKSLECVFEYDDIGRGIYEDEVLQYLDKYHPLAIEGVRVVFRPLNDRQSGSIDDYLKNFQQQLEDADAERKRQLAQEAKYSAWEEYEVPEPPSPKEFIDDNHGRDYQSKIDIDIYQDYENPEAVKSRTGIGKGVPFSRDEISQLAAALGTTTDMKQGGWILPDGRLIHFIKNGVRRKEQDIGIGFTEERKNRIASDINKYRKGLEPQEHRDDSTGPYDINGYAQSQPVDPWGSLAKKSYPEAFPLEAIRGGLIRYAISPDGDSIEIDAYQMPTQGQMDILEDIYEWIKAVNEGDSTDSDKPKEPTVEKNKELTFTGEPQSPQPPAPTPAPVPQGSPAQNMAQDGMVDEDNYEKVRRDRIDEADKEERPFNTRFNSPYEPKRDESEPKSRQIIVYVGTGSDDWWDYETVEDVHKNLVKDLRTYWREGKKPNEDFNLPDEDEDDGLDAHGEPQEKAPAAQDEAVGWLKARNADIFPKRIYRPRTTLLQQVDYETARRIIRENVALIKTIPFLDVLKAEQKVIAYFRKKITRDQLAKYFYRIADGAITKAWAEVIADDQINKASERLRVAKWKKNGVRMVRWVHSNFDEPRPYHREKWNGASGIFDGVPNGLNGYVFPIDFPPVIDLATRERGYPGQLINCKCHLEPVR